MIVSLSAKSKKTIREIKNIFKFDIFINCNWVITRWQYTFKHKQHVEQHK